MVVVMHCKILYHGPVCSLGPKESSWKQYGKPMLVLR